tara:strand:- start:496 stop:975 length:480 start_codon:yes stop_codon:yes gene_type:complete
MIEWKYPINAQAKAVRCYLEGYDGLDVSWVEYNGHGSFSAELSIGEWDNGRERGYIVSCRQSGVPRQMNIAFFEHRNTDSINAISFETKPRWQIAPTLADVPDDKYKELSIAEWDTDHSVDYGHAGQMAKWIMDEFTRWWKAEIDRLSGERLILYKETN